MNIGATISEEDATIIKGSLRRELALSEMKDKLLVEEIEEFEQKYGLSSEKFEELFEHGEFGDDQDYFEWWGLIRGLETTRRQIDRIKAVLSH